MLVLNIFRCNFSPKVTTKVDKQIFHSSLIFGFRPWPIVCDSAAQHLHSFFASMANNLSIICNKMHRWCCATHAIFPTDLRRTNIFLWHLGHCIFARSQYFPLRFFSKNNSKSWQAKISPQLKFLWFDLGRLFVTVHYFVCLANNLSIICNKVHRICNKIHMIICDSALCNSCTLSLAKILCTHVWLVWQIICQ